ncbi:MAG: RDD family protein [Chloroflexota bacterium]
MTANSYAGLWVRIRAFSLDYIIIALYLSILVGVSIGLNFVFPKVVSTLFGHPLQAQFIGFITVTLPVTLYFTFTESSSWQASWGKRRQGLRLVRTDGAGITFGRALVRTLLKFVPWELAHTCIWQISVTPSEPSPLITAGFIIVWVSVGANIVWLWVSPSHQTIYDWLADTYIIGGKQT